MDMSKLLGPRPSGARLPESDLRKLAQEAGLREESWKRREDVEGGELYECPLGDPHERILTVFRKEYVCIYTHPDSDSILTGNTGAGRTRMGDNSKPQHR